VHARTGCKGITHSENVIWRKIQETVAQAGHAVTQGSLAGGVTITHASENIPSPGIHHDATHWKKRNSGLLDRWYSGSNPYSGM